MLDMHAHAYAPGIHCCPCVNHGSGETAERVIAAPSCYKCWILTRLDPNPHPHCEYHVLATVIHVARDVECE